MPWISSEVGNKAILPSRSKSSLKNNPASIVIELLVTSTSRLTGSELKGPDSELPLYAEPTKSLGFALPKVSSSIRDFNSSAVTPVLEEGKAPEIRLSPEKPNRDRIINKPSVRACELPSSSTSRFPNDDMYSEICSGSFLNASGAIAPVVSDSPSNPNRCLIISSPSVNGETSPLKSTSSEMAASASACARLACSSITNRTSLIVFSQWAFKFRE